MGMRNQEEGQEGHQHQKLFAASEPNKDLNLAWPHPPPSMDLTSHFPKVMGEVYCGASFVGSIKAFLDLADYNEGLRMRFSTTCADTESIRKAGRV